jgi:hypothetical protein
MAYRCTRINEFTANTSIADRQGYYLKASSIKEALELMARRFPSEQFTIEIWQ